MTTLKSLDEAAALLSQYEATDAARVRETAALESFIKASQAAWRGLRDVEVAAAVGEVTATTATKARKQLEEAHGALDAQARKLEGLRMRLLDLAAQMPQHFQRLRVELSEYAEELKQSFAQEWSKAAAAFAPTLAKRRALEQLLGESLDLPEPGPEGAPDLSQLSGPQSRLAKLREIVDGAAYHAGSRAATTIDPHIVFVLTRDTGELPQGSLVVSSSFPPGRLEVLVELGRAVPARDPEDQKVAKQAAEAKQRIEELLKREENERPEAEARARRAAQNARTRELTGEEDSWPRLSTSGEYGRLG